MSIHPTAIVHPDAQISEDAEVQAYSIIGPHVAIGTDTVVGPHCVIEGRTVIGERNHFYSGAQIGVTPQDLKHKPGLIGRTVIGDDNVFREHMSVSTSTMTSEEEHDRTTSIGSNCLFMTCSHIGHDCHVGDAVIMANSVALSGHVEVEDRANIGGLSGVHQDCIVGTLAFIGGMSRVTKDAPPYMIVEGNPARCAGPNTVGLKRNGLDEDARRRIKELFKIICRSKLNTTQALAEIERSVDACEERDHLLQFIRSSVRGIIK